jgi:hypothetical protein
MDVRAPHAVRPAISRTATTTRKLTLRSYHGAELLGEERRGSWLAAAFARGRDPTEQRVDPRDPQKRFHAKIAKERKGVDALTCRVPFQRNASKVGDWLNAATLPPVVHLAGARARQPSPVRRFFEMEPFGSRHPRLCGSWRSLREISSVDQHPKRPEPAPPAPLDTVSSMERPSSTVTPNQVAAAIVDSAMKVRVALDRRRRETRRGCAAALGDARRGPRTEIRGRDRAPQVDHPPEETPRIWTVVPTHSLRRRADAALRVRPAPVGVRVPTRTPRATTDAA